MDGDLTHPSAGVDGDRSSPPPAGVDGDLSVTGGSSEWDPAELSRTSVVQFQGQASAEEEDDTDREVRRPSRGLRCAGWVGRCMSGGTGGGGGIWDNSQDWVY